jgi:hypothetical protein
MDLKAEKVEIIVNGLLRRRNFPMVKPAEVTQCPCAQQVCRMFESLLQRRGNSLGMRQVADAEVGLLVQDLKASSLEPAIARKDENAS